MAKIKFTKTELKAQQDSLKQFVRFLPTLQLKKQQLRKQRLNNSKLQLCKADHIMKRDIFKR